MDEFGGLLLNGGDDFRMAVAGGDDGDAGGKVEELIAVDIFDAQATPALRDHGIGARVAGRDEAVVGLDDAAGLGTGERRLQLRAVLLKNLGCDGHVLSLRVLCGCGAAD